MKQPTSVLSLSWSQIFLACLGNSNLTSRVISVSWSQIFLACLEIEMEFSECCKLIFTTVLKWLWKVSLCPQYGFECFVIEFKIWL